MIDLTPFVNIAYLHKPLTYCDGRIGIELTITKRFYDEIRLHKGEFYLDGEVYDLYSTGLDYISIGEDYTIDIRMVLKPTEWWIREKKINKLLS